ncbi:galactose ABC transporter substrate-binding protein [Enterococcus sp. LJL98]
MKNWKVLLSFVFLASALLVFFISRTPRMAEERLRSDALKIGVSLYRGDDEFISSVSRALEEASPSQAKQYHRKNQLKIVDAKNSQTIQNTQIDQFIRQDYDVIAVNVVDRTVASSLIYKAKQANIPIIFFNREPIETDLRQWEQAFYVGSQAQESGEMEGRLVWETFLANPVSIDLNGDGKIQYVMLEGEEVHQDSLIRTESSIQSLVDAGIKVERIARGVGNWMRQPSKEFVLKWLTDYPNQIELIISNNDEMALGAIEAIQETAGNWSPKVVGIDGTKEGLAAVDEGQMLGTILSDVHLYAEKIFEIAYTTAQNQALKPQYFWIPHQMYLQPQEKR